MKISLTFTIILFYSIALAQSTEQAKLRRFSFGLNVSPDMAYRSAKEPIFNDETPRLGITAGGSFSYDITKRLSIETGAAYSLKGYTNKPRQVFMYQGAEPLYEGKMRERQNLHCIDVPLQFNFVLFKGKFQLILNTGAVWTHMFHHSRDLLIPFTVESSRNWVTFIKQHSTFASNTVSSTFGLGLRVNVSDRMNLNVIPTFQYAWIPIHTNLMNNDVKLYSARLSIGLKYDLF